MTTTAATKPKPESAEPSEALLPGPALLGTKYELIRPRTVHPGAIGIGREMDTAVGVIGRITAITYVGEGRTRVTIEAGSEGRSAFVDLFGDWIGTVTETGAKWHRPIVVSPAVAAARTALGRLNQADRVAALEGYTPKPAA